LCEGVFLYFITPGLPHSVTPSPYHLIDIYEFYDCFLKVFEVNLMRSSKTRFIAFITTFSIISPVLPLHRLEQWYTSQALAETVEERRAEGDRLLEQAEEQRQNYQPQAALETAQQALSIYRVISDRRGAGRTLRTLGRAYFQLEDYETAIEYHQQALDIARAIGDRDLEWRSLKNLGDTYVSLNRITEAIALFEQSLSIARELSDREGEGSILTSLGNAFDELKQNDRATDYLQQGLAIARETSDRATEEYALRLLGWVYQRMRDYPQAIEYFQQSLAVGREMNDPATQAFSLVSLQSVYQELEEYSQAILANQQGLAFAQEMANRRLEITFLSNLSILYKQSGKLNEAIDAGQRRLTIAQELQSPQLEIDALRYLTVLHVQLGNYIQAGEYAQRYSSIAQQTDNPEQEALGLQMLASIQYQLGKYPEAINAHERVIDLAREVSNSELEFESLEFIGNIYLAGLSNYPRAIERYQQQLAVAQQAQNFEWQIEALHNLGSALSNLARISNSFTGSNTSSNYYAQAISYYQQSLSIAQKIENQQWEAVTLDQLSFVYYLLENYRQAVEYAEQSLSILQKLDSPADEIDTLITLVASYNALEDRRSIEYAQQAVALGEKLFLPGMQMIGLMQLGLSHRIFGEHEAAIAAYQQSLAVARESQDLNSEADILNNLGETFLESGNVTAAEEVLYDAIEIFESLRTGLGEDDENKLTIFEDQSSAYRTLQQVLIARNKAGEALEVAEQGRARALIGLLAVRQAAPTLAATPNIAAIKDIAQQQNATLVQYSVIDPFIGSSSFYIWVVKPTGEVHFEQVTLTSEANDSSGGGIQARSDNSVVRGTPQEAVISQLVEGDRTTSRGSDRATIAVERAIEITSQTRLQHLHQLLIDPIAQYLPTNPEERVIFIPQGALFLVPFPALQDANGDYLIEKHTILTAPSIQVLALTRDIRQSRASQQRDIQNISPSDLLIVGNPVMPPLPQVPGTPPVTLTPLPGAEEEALEIGRFFNADVLTGSAATEAAVTERMQTARIIHLATHGLLEYGIPQDSGVRDLPGAIALTPSSEDDGLLTSAELYDMNLNAELVILSACDTGRGRIQGDGVIGLSRSLIAAGVPSVIVSLWAVPDVPTASLMTEFYRQWQQNTDKAQALRQAMLTTMQTHPDPRDWAAFTLIGEAE
jgi:CHAT domain-containing protein/uncharacterized protein HemY